MRQTLHIEGLLSDVAVKTWRTLNDVKEQLTRV